MVRAQIEAPGNSLADPGEHDEGIGESREERVDEALDQRRSSPIGQPVFITMAMSRRLELRRTLWISSCISGNAPEESCKLLPVIWQCGQKLPLALPKVSPSV